MAKREMAEAPAQEAPAAPPPAPAPKMPEGKKTVEEWASEKGMMPAGHQEIDDKQQTVHPGMKEWPDFWKFRAARAWARWVVGAEVTEEEFDQAVKDATNARIG